jgi:hypothetical protein
MSVRFGLLDLATKEDGTGQQQPMLQDHTRPRVHPAMMLPTGVWRQCEHHWGNVSLAASAIDMLEQVVHIIPSLGAAFHVVSPHALRQRPALLSRHCWLHILFIALLVQFVAHQHVDGVCWCHGLGLVEPSQCLLQCGWPLNIKHQYKGLVDNRNNHGRVAGDLE